MNKDDCYYLGKVTQPHGVKGEVKIWLDVDDPEDYADMDSVLLEQKGILVPFFIDALAIRGKKSIAKFEGIDSWEAAQPLIGNDMYLPLAALPELDDDQFYYHEIVGYEIQDNDTKEVYGTVAAVYEGTGQDLLMFLKDGKEVLVPINDDIVVGVNKPESILYVSLPDGLIDLYLDDKSGKEEENEE